MNVSKRSWHYRFYQWASDYPVPENLCPYVRGLAWRLPLTGVLIGAAAFLMTVPVLSAVFWVISGVMPTGMWLIVPAVEMSVALLVGIVWLNSISPDVHLPKVDISDNIVYQYCKAVHDKVCPKIDFTE